ncbi:MAG: hypothetical protein ACRDHL_03040 [Candidatus Promineifilaceae bacterium]
MRLWLRRAAGLSVAAGLIHLIVAPAHFAEWFGYGLFFLAAAAAQLAYAALLLKHKTDRTLLMAGIVGNGLILALYLITRTIGIPVGPAVGEVEPVAAWDAISKITELALIVCLVADLSIQPGSP